MEPLRLPRFKRFPEIGNFRLTERDRDILRHVHRHRFLRSSHLTTLIEGSEQQVLRRLQLLFHHGYLARPLAQLDCYYQRGGSRRMTYGLGSKGAALLRQEQPVAPLRWSEKNRAISRFFLEHALLVSDVMVALEHACRQRGDVQLLSDMQLPLPAETRAKAEPFHWQVGVSSRLKCGLIPDRVFGLELPDGERSFCFLEADRGTMPVKREGLQKSSFYRKLLAYEATWSQNIHRSRFGFHRFRVLTVTTSPRRVASLREAARELHSGHGLFLFTDATSLLAAPDALEHFWQPVHDGAPVSLFA